MRYAIISDIHEDVAGLQRAISKIDKLQCDKIICLGDISGFSVPHYHHFDIRNAHECLKILRNNNAIIIPGNHDLNACQRIPEISPEFEYPENWYELDYFHKKSLANGKLWLYEENELKPFYTQEDLKYLKKLPIYQIIENKKCKVMFSHYVYPNISGSYRNFFHKRNDYSEHINILKKNNCMYGFVGHAHNEKSLIITHKKITTFKFRKMDLPKTNAIIVIPAIAGNKRKNGFCIFDFEKNRIETKSI